MCDDHPWKLIAPWWRWSRQLGELGVAPRATRPVVQKYETSDPVSAFLADPQRSLVFTEEDRVHELETLPSPALTPTGKRKRFSDRVLRPTETRRLFLPNHKRFYLVVCELHCDRPGLPGVNREKVCEAGFVVRRNLMSYPKDAEPEALRLLARSTAAGAQLARIDRGSPGRLLKKRHRRTPAGVFGAMAGAATGVKEQVGAALDAEVRARRAELETELARVREELLRWKAEAGAVAVEEAWIPAGFEDVGGWRAVERTPQEVVETVYPLYPLIPDPRDAGHDAAGKTIYFGLIPTGSREVDASGAARFDDGTRYTIRCFVRRHRCECPKTGEPNDCGGELVWSEPTEVYQLAAHFDPVGTANHPITIRLPDIPALAAMSEAKLPVQMISPPGSALKFAVGSDGSIPGAGEGEMGGFPQICYISIPLITIIASFVINLFLPIVVFVFNLWFLLGLKFCIPPSVSFAAGADAELSAKLNVALQAELDVAASLGADLEASAALTAPLGVSVNLGVTGAMGASGGLGGTDEDPAIAGNDLVLQAGTPGAKLTAGYDLKVDGEPQPQPGFSNSVAAGVAARVSGTVSAEAAGTAPGAGLAYEARVPRPGAAA